MTENHYKKIKNSLESINKITLKEKSSEQTKDGYKVEYKHKIIDLDGYSLIVSGSAEQFFNIQFSREKIFLFITVFDPENNELKFSPNQHTKIRKLVNHKVLA